MVPIPVTPAHRTTFRRGVPAAAAVVLLVTLPGQGHAGDALERVRRDLRAGHYERARKAADVLSRGARAPAEAAVLAARAEQRLGLLLPARHRLERASVAAPDDLPLRAELMRVADALGDRGAVKALVDRSYEDWDAGRVGKTDKTRAPDLAAMAVALRFDNNWDDANQVVRDAVKANPRFVQANLDWGEMFLEKHTPSQAEASFRDVLAVDPGNPEAHAGLARALLEGSYDSAAAEKEIAAALATNPRHPRALALRGEIALDAEELDQVAAVVRELRRSNPGDEAAAALASARALLLDDRAGFEREMAARLAIRPNDGDFFARVAEALVRHRRYDEARAVAEDGVARDERNPRALASLGLTLLRLGHERQGIEVLRRAWDRDPYDARTFNLLNLFEKVIPPGYITVQTKHLAFRVEPRERVAIEAVVGPFLEEVYGRYVERYGFEPAGPITFELYGEPAHYAIRTVGLPRLGVTAVCFGRVITSQAPGRGAYNWGMVLAHELAHVFALQLSRSRVPRWFTEGLSELETAELRPEWRRHGEIALAAALTAGVLPPFEKLSQGFVRARDAESASVAYLHAALAVEFLQARFGFAKIRAALAAFGRGERLPAVLETLSGMPPPALERAFADDLAARLAPYRGQFLPAQMARVARAREVTGDPRGASAAAQAGLDRLTRGDARAARQMLAKALLLPGGRNDPSVSFLAAELALAAGEAATATEELGGLLARGIDGYDVRMRLAFAARRAQDDAAAEAHLRRAIALAPTHVEPRLVLSALLGARAGRARAKLAEDEAVLRLEPQSAALAKRVVLEHARAGHPDAVADLAPIALFIDPGDADIHAAQGRALAAQGKAREAIRAYERALLFSPADAAGIHRATADLLDRVGETGRAAQHRRKGLGARP